MNHVKKQQKACPVKIISVKGNLKCLKKDLRKKYMDLRKTLSKDEVLSLSQKIFENFVLQFNVIENQKVHIFFQLKN